MRTFILRGYLQADNGNAGDWHEVVVVRGKNADDAAKRLCCEVVSVLGDGDHRLVYGRGGETGFVSRVAKAIIASKRLRGAKRSEELAKIERALVSYCSLSLYAIGRVG